MNKLKWTDVHALAISLEEGHPECAILSVRFTDLKKMVLALEGFDDDPARSNEKTLEAIQMAWLHERE